MNEPGSVELDDLCDRSPRGPEDTRDDYEVWEAMREGADVAAIMRLLRRDLPGVAEHLDARVAELRAEMEAHRKPEARSGAAFERRVLQRIDSDPSVADHAMQSLSRRLAPGDPVGSLAGDLCEMAICEAMPPEEIVRTAAACRRAAEICYGEPVINPDWTPYRDPIPPSTAAAEGTQAIRGSECAGLADCQGEGGDR